PSIGDAARAHRNHGSPIPNQHLKDRDSITAPTTLSLTPKQLDESIAAGARRLLARAQNARSLKVEALAKRLCAATELYVVKVDPSAAEGAVEEFLGGLHAGALGLVISCERSDQTAG